MPERTEVQMARLLSLVSWIGEHPGAELDRAARHFGRSRDQMVRDVNLLGDVHDSLPGSSFEVDWELLAREERLRIRTTMGVDLPPRLTPAEASAVLIGLRAIAPVLDDDLRARLPRTAMAVAALSPGSDGVSDEVVVSGAPRHDARLDILNEAMRVGRQVGFEYTSLDGRRGRREVDPWDLHRSAEGWTLRGWCHAADGERSFRLERMDAVTVLDSLADHPRKAAEDRPDAPRVRLTLTDAARWVAEEVPCRVTEQGSGRFVAEIEVWDRDWVEALLIDVAPHLLDVDPPDVAQTMAQRARRALDVWEER
jgi:proteasome accessory factor C